MNSIDFLGKLWGLVVGANAVERVVSVVSEEDAPAWNLLRVRLGMFYPTWNAEGVDLTPGAQLDRWALVTKAHGRAGRGAALRDMMIEGYPAINRLAAMRDGVVSDEEARQLSEAAAQVDLLRSVGAEDADRFCLDVDAFLAFYRRTYSGVLATYRGGPSLGVVLAVGVGAWLLFGRKG